MVLYPLKFKPIIKEKIWGGTHLNRYLPVTTDKTDIGELWTLSSYPEAVSVVENGYLRDNELNELIEVYMGDLVGDKVYDAFGTEFPLIIKLIDANDDLSIQVHPSDDEQKGISGKTEMWYVLSAEPDSSILYGLTKDCTKEEIEQSIASGTLLNVINRIEVKPADAVLINSGMVHSLCKGTTVVEVQQCSDETYRLYDYHRRDAQGNTRPLHIRQALDVMTLSKVNDGLIGYEAKANGACNLVKCPFFTVNILEMTEAIGRDYAPLDSFVVYVCVEGEGIIETDEQQTTPIKKGETVLIPASLNDVVIRPLTSTCRLMEIYIE